ncbi:MAG: phosphodiester glycosidase family protein [Pseudomonadota bacterium]|nr:phosphodiester glycosidase family protein [Pseudomonadota bacterium]
MLLFASLALAADTWTSVAPGIDRLYRTTSDPNHVHAAVVDLGRPEIWLRATREDERQATVSSWASDVGATVAINGDWFSYTDYYPVGLAIAGGWGWAGQDDTADWSFIACNVTKDCWIDPWGNAAAWTPRAWNAVGGNSVLLVIDGVAQVNADAFYSSDLAPRSAVGISADGETLYLVVVDGRSSSSEGMTFNQMGALLLELGASDAMMLDGGGSSTLWVEGSVVNSPSDGSPRTVSNHLAVMVSSSTDSRCASLPNGKYCLDATRMATCEGGAFSEGDCGYYGLSCEASGDFAYCVDPRCTNGGQASFCDSATVIGACTDGVVTGTGDCAYYGATCEASSGTAYCVDYRCAGDGNQGWCDGELSRTCAMGVYAEADCATSGLVCDGGACVTPGDDTDPPDTDADTDLDTDPPVSDDPEGARPGTWSRLDGLGCGCDGVGGGGAGWAVLVGVLVVRRRSGGGG